MRAIFESLPVGALCWRRGLQFSPDPSIREGWFRRYEISVFGEETGLDLQSIGRPDASYDFVSLNHVIEFVPDAKRSFRELTRILSPRGVLQIGFSNLSSHPSCVDFREAQGTHRYFHLFGADFDRYFELEAQGVSVISLAEPDPVTSANEEFHFFSRRKSELEAMGEAVRQARRVRLAQQQALPA